MNLQCEDAALRAGGVLEVNALVAVHGGHDFVAERDDLVGVPVVLFHVLLAGVLPQQLAAVLLVEFAPPAFAGVGLVALGDALGDFAAELDAAVGFVGR